MSQYIYPRRTIHIISTYKTDAFISMCVRLGMIKHFEYIEYNPETEAKEFLVTFYNVDYIKIFRDLAHTLSLGGFIDLEMNSNNIQ